MTPVVYDITYFVYAFEIRVVGLCLEYQYFLKLCLGTASIMIFPFKVDEMISPRNLVLSLG